MQTIKFKAWDAIGKQMLDPKTIQEFCSEVTISKQSAERLVFLPYIGELDKNGIEIYEGDIFIYKKHKGYLLDDFKGEILFENGAFGFGVITGQVYSDFTPLCEIDELKEDFLNLIEVVGNVHCI